MQSAPFCEGGSAGALLLGSLPWICRGWFWKRWAELAGGTGQPQLAPVPLLLLPAATHEHLIGFPALGSEPKAEWLCTGASIFGVLLVCFSREHAYHHTPERPAICRGCHHTPERPTMCSAMPATAPPSALPCAVPCLPPYPKVRSCMGRLPPHPQVHCRTARQQSKSPSSAAHPDKRSVSLF